MRRFATTDDTPAYDAPDGHFDSCDTLGHRPEHGVCVDCGARVPEPVPAVAAVPAVAEPDADAADAA